MTDETRYQIAQPVAARSADAGRDDEETPGKRQRIHDLRDS